MNAMQIAVPAAGSPIGVSRGGSVKGFFEGRAGASSSDDSFEQMLGAQFAALLQSGIPLAQIVERLANAPPGSTAAPQAAALARELATIAGRAAGEAVATTAGQQNDISGYVLDADTLARELPAQHDTAAATASDSTSLPPEMIAQIAAALQLPPVLQSGTPSQSASAPPQDTGAATPQAAQSTVGSPDLLMRMLARAANADAQASAQNVAPPAENSSSAASVASANAPQPTSPASAPTTGALVGAELARLAASATQGQSSGGSQSNADLLAGDASDRDVAKLLASPKKDASSGMFAVPSFANALQNVSQGAQSTQSASTPAFDAEAVIAQIVKSVSMHASDTEQHVSLRLQPENLGDVSMKISVTGSQINAVLTAQNADVRDLLLANAQQLARSFAGAGLKLGSFSVNVSGGNAQGDARRNGGGSDERHRVVGTSAAQAANDRTEPQYGLPIASARGLMNYFA